MSSKQRPPRPSTTERWRAYVEVLQASPRWSKDVFCIVGWRPTEIEILLDHWETRDLGDRVSSEAVRDLVYGVVGYLDSHMDPQLEASLAARGVTIEDVRRDEQQLERPPLPEVLRDDLVRWGAFRIFPEGKRVPRALDASAASCVRRVFAAFLRDAWPSAGSDCHQALCHLPDRVVETLARLPDVTPVPPERPLLEVACKGCLLMAVYVLHSARDNEQDGVFEKNLEASLCFLDRLTPEELLVVCTVASSRFTGPLYPPVTTPEDLAAVIGSHALPTECLATVMTQLLESRTLLRQANDRALRLAPWLEVEPVPIRFLP